MSNLSGELQLRVGVELGAGSAAAMAQIGALEVFARAGIPVHCVAGTSAGAIVGAAFAGGRLSELRERLEGLSRRRMLRLFDLAWPREGLLHGRRALDFIRPHLGETIEALNLPYAAVATELRSGDEVVLTRGAVYDAVRASIAIPGILSPWRVGGRLLVDGGLVDPVPVSAARALGAEFVIALNVLPLREPRKPARWMQDQLQLLHSGDRELGGAEEEVNDRLGLVEVVWQASRILESQVPSSRLREDRPERLLQIPVPEVGMFDMHRTRKRARVSSGSRARRAARGTRSRRGSFRARRQPFFRWRRCAPSILDNGPDLDEASAITSVASAR